MNAYKMISKSGAGLPAFGAVLLTLLLMPGKGYSQNDPDLYLRAPDVIPGTLPEMRTTSYWIDRMENPEEVVMTLAQIEQMNRRYHQKMSDFAGLDSNTVQRIGWQLRRSPGLVATMPDLDSKTPAEIAAIVRDIVGRQIQYLRRRSFGNRLGIQYSDSELNAIEAELSYDTIAGQTEIQPGITVENSRLRIIPSIRPEYTGLTQVGKTRWDLWNLDIVPIGSPVQILHVSESGGFLFVLSERGYGWIKSEKIAVGSESEIQAFTEAGNFIIVTGDRVPFYSNSNSIYVSGWLRMGDRLPRADNNNPRLIQVPVRQMNGEFAIQEAWLAPDADVHAGYLPYTRKNVVVQAFNLLDNIYDWTGAWYGRNHATGLRDIFSTFGFELPSNGVLLSLYNDNTRVISSDLDEEARYEAIFSNEPFLTFQTSRSGHSQLYLGEYNGQAIVFDTHGYSYEDESGRELEIRRCVVGTLSLPSYMLRQDITVTEMR